MNISGYKVKINGKYHFEGGNCFFEQSGTFIEFHGHIKRIEADIIGKTIEYPAFLTVMVNETGKLRAAVDNASWLIDDVDQVQFYEVRNGSDHQVLYEGDGAKDITVRIIKITEEQYGTVVVQRLDIEGDVLPTGDRDKRFLFIGDSITCGYGIDGINGEVFTTASENFLKAYPYLLAEKMYADYDTLCWSGDGIISRWIPEEEDMPLEDSLIPDLFRNELQKNVPNSDRKYTNIFVNIGTNDASYTRGVPQREERFAEAYKAFLTEVHEAYTAAKIYAVYEVMERSLAVMIQKIVKELKNDGMRIEYLNCSGNYELDAVDGHPSEADHRELAERIRGYLREIESDVQ